MDKGLSIMFNAVVEAMGQNTTNFVELQRILCSLFLSIPSKTSPLNNNIIRLYASLLRHPQTCARQQSEFAMLGDTIVLLMTAWISHGPDALVNCKLSLPFCDLMCEPTKFPVAVSNLKEVLELLTMWCGVFRQFIDIENKKFGTPRSDATFTRIALRMAQLAGQCECTTNPLMTLCSAVRIAVNGTGNTDCDAADKHGATSGLLQWVEFAMRRTCSSLNGRRRIARATAQIMRTSAEAVCSAVRGLSSSGSSECAAQMLLQEWVFQRATDLLTTYIVQQRIFLVELCVGELSRAAAAGPASHDCAAESVAAVFASQLLALLPASADCQRPPSLRFLLQCCVDLATAQAACHWFVGHLRTLCARDSSLVGLLAEAVGIDMAGCAGRAQTAHATRGDSSATSSSKRARFADDRGERDESEEGSDHRHEALVFEARDRAGKRKALSASTEGASVVTPQRVRADKGCNGRGEGGADGAGLMSSVEWLASRVRQAAGPATVGRGAVDVWDSAIEVVKFSFFLFNFLHFLTFPHYRWPCSWRCAPRAASWRVLQATPRPTLRRTGWRTRRRSSSRRTPTWRRERTVFSAFLWRGCCWRP